MHRGGGGVLQFVYLFIYLMQRVLQITPSRGTNDRFVKKNTEDRPIGINVFYYLILLTRCVCIDSLLMSNEKQNNGQLFKKELQEVFKK